MKVPTIPEYLEKYGIKPLTAGTEQLFQPSKGGLHLAGFDCETVGSNLFVKNDLFTAQIVADKKENSHIFFPEKQGVENLEFFFEACKKPCKRVFASAHNAGFDIGALLGKDVFQLMQGKPVNGWEGKVIESVSSFAILRHPATGRQITIADSMAWFKCSLATFAKTYLKDEKKLDRPPYLGKRTPKTQKELEYFCDYAEQDAVIQLEATKMLYAFCKEGNVKVCLTPAQLAGRVFQKQYLKNRVFVPYPRHLRFIVKTYHGASFTAFGRGYFEDVYYYDINSLYPAAALSTPLNFSNSKLVSLTPDDVERGHVGFVKVKFRFPEADNYPNLPEVRFIRGFPKLVFPRKGWSYTTTAELSAALKKGVEILEFYGLGWYPTEGDIRHPLAGYVSDIYEKKAELDKIKEKEGLSEELHAKRDYYKFLLNSLIGKFCQRNRTWLTNKEVAGSLFKPDFGALVLSKSREIINGLVSENRAIYSDTDSLLTKRKLETGVKLGQLKNELGKNKKGDLLSIRSKLYFVLNEGSVVKAAKHGFRQPTKEVFKKILEKRNRSYVEYSVNRLTRLKESYRRELLPRREISQSFKIMLSDDGKREYETPLVTVNDLLENQSESRPLQD